jgi:hypothetical protein
MKESMEEHGSETRKTTLCRLAEIGPVFAEEPHSAVPHCLAEQMGHRAEWETNRPRGAALDSLLPPSGLRLWPTGGSGQPVQLTDPLLVTGTARKSLRRVL